MIGLGQVEEFSAPRGLEDLVDHELGNGGGEGDVVDHEEADGAVRLLLEGANDSSDRDAVGSLLLLLHLVPEEGRSVFGVAPEALHNGVLFWGHERHSLHVAPPASEWPRELNGVHNRDDVFVRRGEYARGLPVAALDEIMREVSFFKQGANL